MSIAGPLVIFGLGLAFGWPLRIGLSSEPTNARQAWLCVAIVLFGAMLFAAGLTMAAKGL